MYESTELRIVRNCWVLEGIDPAPFLVQIVPTILLEPIGACLPAGRAAPLVCCIYKGHYLEKVRG